MKKHSYCLEALKLLKILQKNTDEDSPRLREELLADFEDEYGTCISESTFDRYLKALREELDLEIRAQKKKGYSRISIKAQFRRRLVSCK